LEEKLVYYADKWACEDQLVLVDELMYDLKKKNHGIGPLVAKAELKIKLLEKEIFDKINVSIELK